jgi:hypothetical protein
LLQSVSRLINSWEDKPFGHLKRGANDMTRVGGETAWTSIEELFERTFGARSATARFPLLKKTEKRTARG